MTTTLEPVTLPLAIEIAQAIESVIAPGWHCGLAGGCLHQDGPRKDADIFIYAHGTPPCGYSKVVEKLGSIGLAHTQTQDGGRYQRDIFVCTYLGRHRVDLFFP